MSEMFRSSEFGESNCECTPTLNDQLKNFRILRRTNLFFSVLFIKVISTFEDKDREAKKRVKRAEKQSGANLAVTKPYYSGRFPPRVKRED